MAVSVSARRLNGRRAFFFEKDAVHVCISKRIRLWVTQRMHFNGRSLRGDSASLYSYDMEIARHVDDSGGKVALIHVVSHGPSRTTQRHIDTVRQHAVAAGYVVVVCDPVGMPYSSAVGAPIDGAWSVLQHEMRLWCRRHGNAAVTLKDGNYKSATLKAMAQSAAVGRLISLMPTPAECELSVVLTTSYTYTTAEGAVFEEKLEAEPERFRVSIDCVKFVGAIPAPIRRYLSKRAAVACKKRGGNG